MRFYLENDLLKVELCDEGGEIYRIQSKKDNSDFLWNGRKFGWPLSAPTLFPVIGKVKDYKYYVDGKEYNMSQHGFASWSNFKVIEETASKIKFELIYDEEYLKLYPYKFVFRIEYSLEKNKISVKYEVENLDEKNIVFSIGAHPSFICPMSIDDNLKDYYLEFSNKEEKATILEINKSDYLTGNERIYLEDTNIIDLHEDIFKNGTLIFNNLKSTSISLKNKVNSKYVKVDFTGFPYLALWGPENTRPFICIEPWFGHADYEDFNDDFSKKKGNIILEANNIFTCSYLMEFGA